MVAQVATHYAPSRPHLDPGSAQAARTVPDLGASPAAGAVPDLGVSPTAGPSPSWPLAAVAGQGPPVRTQDGAAGTVPPWAEDGLGPAGDGEPALAVLVHTLRAAGPAGRTIGELKAATGRSRSWVYLRLGELAEAGQLTGSTAAAGAPPAPPPTAKPTTEGEDPAIVQSSMDVHPACAGAVLPPLRPWTSTWTWTWTTTHRGHQPDGRRLRQLLPLAAEVFPARRPSSIWNQRLAAGCLQPRGRRPQWRGMDKPPEAG
jgi:hypothetical protein